MSVTVTVRHIGRSTVQDVAPLPPAPLATVDLHHATVELWPQHVVTRFKADGALVPATPNGDETLAQTAIHEALHSMIAEAVADQPSECLRAVADGDGRRWTDARRYEEGLAFSIGNRMTQLLGALLQAGYMRRAR